LLVQQAASTGAGDTGLERGSHLKPQASGLPGHIFPLEPLECYYNNVAKKMATQRQNRIALDIAMQAQAHTVDGRRRQWR
jgi:hypothetical protein